MTEPTTSNAGGSASALATILTLNLHEAIGQKQSFNDYVRRMLQVGEAIDQYCPTTLTTKDGEQKRNRVKGSPTLEQLETRIGEAKLPQVTVVQDGDEVQVSAQKALGVSSQAAVRKAFPWRSQGTLSIVRQAFWAYGLDVTKAMSAVKAHEKENGVAEDASYRDRVHATFKKVQGPRNKVTTSQAEPESGAVEPSDTAGDGESTSETVIPQVTNSPSERIRTVNDALLFVIANVTVVDDDNLKAALTAFSREAQDRVEQEEREQALAANPNLDVNRNAA